MSFSYLPLAARNVSRATGLASALLVAGCSDAHTASTRDPAAPRPDASAAGHGASSFDDASSEGSVVETQCPDKLPSCPPGSGFAPFDTWSTLLEKREFGDGAILHAVGGSGVLVREGTGDWLLVSITVGPDLPPQRRSWRLPAGQRGVAVAERIDHLLVLACSDGDLGCQLWSTEGAGDVLLSASPTVPRYSRPFGLHAGKEGLCVYGEGFWCLRGDSWQPLLSGNPYISRVWYAGQRLVVELFLGGYSVFQFDSNGELNRQDFDDLTFLEPEREGYNVYYPLYHDRYHDLWLWNGHELVPCSGVPPLATFAGSRALALDGTVLSFDPTGKSYCEWQRLAPLGRVVDTSSSQCGIVSNLRVLTESMLLGTTGCAVD